MRTDTELHGDELILDDDCKPSAGGTVMHFLENEVRRLFLERNHARADLIRAIQQIAELQTRVRDLEIENQQLRMTTQSTL